MLYLYVCNVQQHHSIQLNSHLFKNKFILDKMPHVVKCIFGIRKHMSIFCQIFRIQKVLDSIVSHG